jgi:hypothetical protein
MLNQNGRFGSMTPCIADTTRAAVLAIVLCYIIHDVPKQMIARSSSNNDTMQLGDRYKDKLRLHWALTMRIEIMPSTAREVTKESEGVINRSAS